MRNFFRRATMLVFLPLAMVSTAIVVTAAPASAGTAATVAQVVNYTNYYRAKDGCRVKLKANSRIARSAQYHSMDQAKRRKMTHAGRNGSNFVTRARAQGYRYASAENIAAGQTSARSVVLAWYKSPSHRRNIANCGNRSVGVGVSRGTDGRLYWTQDFGRA